MDVTALDIEGFAAKIGAIRMTDAESAVFDRILELAEQQVDIEVSGFAADLGFRLGAILKVALPGEMPDPPHAFKVEIEGRSPLD